MVVMATGGGKSLCLQLPAIALGRPGLIVSPLISLMEDQVGALRRRGVAACLLGSAQNDPRVREDAWSGKYQLVYLTPELAASPQGLERIAKLHRTVGVSLLGIDEAHCISEWGRDFRPDFQRLALVRQALPGVPVIAVTATATPRVRTEVMRRLALVDPLEVLTSFERPNLRFEVRRRAAGGVAVTAAEVAAIVREAGAVVVYVLTTRLADELAEALTAALGRGTSYGAAAYHAKLDPERRTQVHAAFLDDDPSVRAVVATLAYGMGIDKPNVRAVVHVGAPASLEAYYQQAGRAGRDGLQARCVLLWAPGDIATGDLVRSGGGMSPASSAAAGQGTTDVQAYLSSSSCRAAQLVNHFAGGDKAAACLLPVEGPCRGTCDRCDRRCLDAEEDLGAPAKALLLAIRALNCRFGIGRAVSLVMPENPKKKKDAPPSWIVSRAEQLGLPSARSALVGRHAERATESWWRALGGALVAQGLIEYITVSGGGRGGFSSPRLTASGAKVAEADAEMTLMVTPSAEMLDEQRRAASTTRLPATFCRRASREGAQAIAATEPAGDERVGPLIKVDRDAVRRALALFEAPKGAAIETLAAWIESGHDLPAVAKARGVREETVAASLARCAAHGLVDAELLRVMAAQCGVADRATAAAVGAAFAVRVADPDGAAQLGALLSLAKASGAPSGTTYHHVQVVAALVARGAVWFEPVLRE
jgi:RecQ family ATP-dependent DNA helicase